MKTRLTTDFGVRERSFRGGSVAVIVDRGTAMTHRGYNTAMIHRGYNRSFLSPCTTINNQPLRRRIKTTGWTKLIIAMIALLAFTPGKVRAYTKAFFVTDESGGVVTDRVARFRDGSAISLGMYVQKCFSGPDGTFDYAPPTNFGWSSQPTGESFTNYLPAECAEYQVGTCKMGDDDSGLGLTVKPGSVSGAIGSSDTTRRGWLRCFSGPHITNSAYYGDTIGDDANRSLGNANDPGDWAADPIANIVNPAYVIPFALAAPPDMQATTVPSINATGTVYTSPLGGNNQLEDSMVSVRWENVTLGTSGYVAVNNGAWVASDIPLDYNPPNSQTNTLTFRAVGISPRPGLPISELQTVQVVALPEPAILCAVLAVLAAAAARFKAHRA